MKHLFFTLIGLSLILPGCIGDDIQDDEVDETFRITTALDTLGQGQTFQLRYRYTNNIGVEEEPDIFWNTSDASILSVNDNGLLTGEAKGTATVTARVELPDETLMDEMAVVVDEETIEPPPPPPASTSRTGTIKTTSSYLLEGSFEVFATDTGIRIEIAGDYQASTALPGLYVYLGNNPSSIANALELQAVTVFEGAHVYEVEGASLEQYDYLLYWCKPFGVKVGDGQME